MAQMSCPWLLMSDPSPLVPPEKASPSVAPASRRLRSPGQQSPFFVGGSGLLQTTSGRLPTHLTRDYHTGKIDYENEHSHQQRGAALDMSLTLTLAFPPTGTLPRSTSRDSVQAAAGRCARRSTRSPEF